MRNLQQRHWSEAPGWKPSESCCGGILGGGIKGGIFNAQLPLTILPSILPSFVHLLLLSLVWPFTSPTKTPAAVGGEREGGKGGGGGRGWGRQVCQSFHPPVAIPFLCIPLIQRFTLLYIFFTLGRYISPPGVETCYHRNTFPSIKHFSFLFLLYNTLLSLFRAPVWTPQLIHSPITLQPCFLLRLFMFLVADFVWRWPVTRKCLFWEKVKARNTPVCAFIKTFIHSEDLWGYHERLGLLSLTTDCVHVLKQYKFLFLVSLSRWFGAKHHLSTANPHVCLDKIFIQQIGFMDSIHFFFFLFFRCAYSSHVLLFLILLVLSGRWEMRCLLWLVFSTNKLIKREQHHHLFVQL